MNGARAKFKSLGRYPVRGTLDNMAGRKAVRPINILTDSYFCIVLRVRESGNSKPGQKAGHRTLKTAQGRHSRRKAVKVEDSSQKRRLRSEQIIRLLSHLNSLRNEEVVEARSSEKERRVDAKALIADEGRDKLRKVLGSCK